MVGHKVRQEPDLEQAPEGSPSHHMTVEYSPHIARIIKKIKDAEMKKAVKNQIRKATENPEIGKPMRFSRAGTRELYVAPFRLSYIYLKAEDKIILLDLYHKDRQ